MNGRTVRVAVTSHDDGLLACPVAHAGELPRRVVVRNVARFYQGEALLEIHTGAERFVSGSCKDCAPQLRLGIVPGKLSVL